MSDGVSFTEVESWDIDRLIPFERNNKKHPDKQVDELAASVAEHGFENPISVEEDGTIISGHGRRLAAIKLGMRKVPVRVFRGITKEQARKLRIAANKTTSTDYDLESLALELADLKELEIDLGGMGLSDKELMVLMDDVGEVDLGSMSTDIVKDVERHEEEVTETADKAEVAEVALSKVFGFKTVTNAQARILSRWIGEVEFAAGKEGVEALIEHAEHFTAEAMERAGD